MWNNPKQKEIEEKTIEDDLRLRYCTKDSFADYILEASETNKNKALHTASPFTTIIAIEKSNFSNFINVIQPINSLQYKYIKDHHYTALFAAHLSGTFRGRYVRYNIHNAYPTNGGNIALIGALLANQQSAS